MATCISRLLLAAAFTVIAPLPLIAETHVWISVDGEFGAGASWSTGKAPDKWAPSDTVIFSTVQTNVDYELDQTSVSVATVFVDPRYEGLIGWAGNPFTIAADAFIHYGTSEAWISGARSGRFNLLIVDPGTGRDVFIGGNYDRVFLKSGTVTVLSDADIQRLTTASLSGQSPLVTIQPGPPIRELDAGGWSITSNRGVESLTVSHGQYIQNALIGNGASISVRGGSFVYQPNQQPPAPGPFGEFLGGNVNLSGSFYSPAFTFGVISPLVTFSASQSPANIGLVDLRSMVTHTAFVDHADSDNDGTPNIYDACDGDAVDVDGDCLTTLRDFAAMQNTMNGP